MKYLFIQGCQRYNSRFLSHMRKCCCYCGSNIIFATFYSATPPARIHNTNTFHSSSALLNYVAAPTTLMGAIHLWETRGAEWLFMSATDCISKRPAGKYTDLYYGLDSLKLPVVKKEKKK